MVTNKTAQILTDPVLIDKAVNEINAALLVEIPWLNLAYGVAERLKRIEDGRTFIYPAVYSGGLLPGPYLSLFPDEHLKNYSFWDIDDGGQISFEGSRRRHKYSFGLIFWFNYNTVYEAPADPDEYSIRNIEDQILNFFRDRGFIFSSVLPGPAYWQADNIYKNYSHREIKDQFLMRPYGGIRIEGTIILNTGSNC